MDTPIQMEERLWDYIDGLSSPAEQSAIEALIAGNIDWQHKYKELLNIHQMMDATELEAPSMRFTKNVMEEIARLHVAPATKTYINKNIIRSIGGFFIAMITGFLVFCLGQFKWSGSGSSSSFLPRYDLNLDTKMKEFNWSKLFNSGYTNVFMLVLVILGLVMLDMYLQRKKQQHLEAHGNKEA
ncbi:hypothetical protein [Flavitalea sp. BT771]|nr:hypothetical protein [Flavitalea sp. BT771]